MLVPVDHFYQVDTCGNTAQLDTDLVTVIIADILAGNHLTLQIGDQDTGAAFVDIRDINGKGAAVRIGYTVMASLPKLLPAMPLGDVPLTQGASSHLPRRSPPCRHTWAGTALM